MINSKNDFIIIPGERDDIPWRIESNEKYKQLQANEELELFVDYIKRKLENNTTLDGTIYFNITEGIGLAPAFEDENGELKKIDYLQKLFPHNIPYTATGVKELFDLINTQNPEINFKINNITDNSVHYTIQKLTQQEIDEKIKQNQETEKFDKIIQELEQLFNSQEFKNAKNKDDGQKIITEFVLKYPELKFKFENNTTYIEYFIRKQNYKIGDLVLCLDNEENLIINTPKKINSINNYKQGNTNTDYVLIKNENTGLDTGIQIDRIISRYGIIKIQK